MRTHLKRAASALLALLMAASVVFASAVAVGAAAKQPSEIERVVVDCRSEEAFKKTSAVYVHTPDQYDPDPLTGGKYSWHSGMKAMSIDYNSGAKAGNEFRILPFFTKKNNLTADYKYLVVVYAAKTTQNFNITVWNGGRQGPLVNALTKGKDTKAKFVATEPVDISEANAEGKSSLWRLINGIHFTLTFVCGDKDAQFFLKEYAFFKSPEDAKAYYKAVDLNKDPEEYGKNAVTPAATPAGANEPTTATVTSGKMTHAGDGLYPIGYGVVEEPAPVVKTPVDEPELDPVIVSFESEAAFSKNAAFPVFMGAQADAGGKFGFTTLDDGTGCLKVEYNSFAPYANYRLMPYLKSGSAPSAQHKYIRVTYMTEDYTKNALTIRNNKTGRTVNLADDTSVSRGRFVTSAPVNIAEGEFLSRYTDGIHNVICFNSQAEGSAFYIKEIAFFSSLKQAYAYYGDEASKVIKYTELLFGTEGKGIAQRDEATWGQSHDTETTLEITYADSATVCNYSDLHYLAKIKPSEKKLTNENQRFMRILYSATNPEGIDSASMVLICDKDNQRVLLSDDVRNTNGGYVLSDTVYLTELMAWRFANSIFNTLVVNTVDKGGSYSIKAAYFFDTREDAENFTVPSESHEITVAGNDISMYQIVVGENAPDNVVSEAKALAANIKKLTGNEIKVVTDEAPAAEHEILFGLSNRPAAIKAHGDVTAQGEAYYSITMDQDDLVVASAVGITFKYAAKIVRNTLFYEGADLIPDTIEVPSNVAVTSYDTALERIGFWKDGEPSAEPTVIDLAFDTDEGYINEDNGEKNWKLENGTYSTAANGLAASYIHTHEKNLTANAKIIFASPAAAGNAGLMVRVNSEHAYVKAGYDMTAKVWFIETRDGRDFYLSRVASFPMEIAPDTVYDVTLTVSGDTASLSVNGQTVIEGAKLDHLSPGRIAVYAENAAVSFDSLTVTLVSGESGVFKDTYHTRIPYDSYLEGGTVHERADGSLSYLHPYGVSYKSLDKGISWQESEKWSDNHAYSYSNMLKLANGSFLRVAQKNIDGKAYKIAQISTDDGNTWQGEYIICESYYKNSTAYGSNMNDKLSQASVSGKWAGRIFYVQTYESTTATGAGAAVEGRNIFCRFYYSDDNGITWQKSETDSWTIPGLENEAYFGEAKLLECADGTIRMYNSWNYLECMVYSESTDGGKTFGPLVKMESIPCPVSSMQFARDPYAENDFTYYMVWLNNEQASENLHVPRARLSLARSTDGKTWEYLGDVMRWESTYLQGLNLTNHAVDPFVYVTADRVIAGTGFSEHTKLAGEGGPTGHLGQRQHIYSIGKATLPAGTVINP